MANEEDDKAQEQPAADKPAKEKKEKPPKADKGEKSDKPDKDKSGGGGGGKDKGGGKGGKGDKGGGKGGKKPKDTGPAPVYKREQPPRLRTTYDQTVRPQMMKEFSYTSLMQVPRLVKITLNMGLGKANQDAKVIDNAIDEIKSICGQAPVVCKAKKDIANFKLRKGQK